MDEIDSMEDTLIDIDETRDMRVCKEKKLKDANILELSREVCRRVYYWLRVCGRWILRKLRLRSANEVDDRSEDESLLGMSIEEQQEQEIKKLKNKISKCEGRLEEKLAEIENLRFENREASNRLEEKLIQMENLRYENQVTVNRHGEEVQSLQYEIENMKAKLKNTMNEKEEMKRSKDDALSRLSELMGAKLRDNNPAITDLNDPNRPMKLGEQFNETYENDWTEAFINLQEMKPEENDNNPITEEETVEILLNILKEVNERSIVESSLQLSGISQSVQDLPKDDTADFIRKVKDAHKSNAVQFAPLFYKKIISDDSDCKTVSKYIHHCQPYVENCAQICYFAAVQDPPLYLDFEPGETFDRQIFKEYTATGTKVRFLVWPALFLHRGGALLSKGVVQPISE